MEPIYKDLFDSNLLKKNVYKLYISDRLTRNNSIQKQIKKTNADIIFCFTSFDNNNIRQLEELGFNLISIRNTYFYNENGSRKLGASLSGKYKIVNDKKAIESINKTNLEELTNILFETSRYSKDHKIDKNIGLNIYRNWVSNSLYHGYADKCIFVIHDQKPAAMITLKIKKDIGSIDLIAVSSKHRKKGLGSILINEAVNYLNKCGISKIEVVTEGENVVANAFYQKNNFLIKNVELVYHKHYGK